jgi:hypothetical protein
MWWLFQVALLLVLFFVANRWREITRVYAWAALSPECSEPTPLLQFLTLIHCLTPW